MTMSSLLCFFSIALVIWLPSQIFALSLLTGSKALPCRRRIIEVALVSVFALGEKNANAFDNRISNKYDDRPKRRGPQPKDLGLAMRTDIEGEEYFGLKTCGYAPNCFSSTMVDDKQHSIPPFVWPANLNQQQAFSQLQEVLQSYPPGQNGVDGGGFQIQKVDGNKGYAYVQYQALKNGYIDDVEFACLPDDSNRYLQIRSSSRIGYLDYGVNAKRINWIAKSLRENGWDAVGVDLKNHRQYAIENELE